MPYPFWKLEAGQETASSGAVAAKTKVPSLKFHPAMGYLRVVQPEEERGNLAAYHRAYVASQLVEGELAGEATFEEITIPLCMTIEDINGTATSTAAGTSYRWVFEPSWTSSNSPGLWTLEYGDDSQAWEANYTFGTGLTISGSTEEAWMVSVPTVSKDNSTTTFTGKSVTSGYTVETILMQETKLYMDDETSAGATTQITGAFLDFEFNLPEHFAPRFTADGEKYFSGVRECKVAPELTLTLVVDSTTKTYITTDYENQTLQVVKIQADGATVSTGYDKYARIEMAGVITDISELTETDCDTTMVLTLTGAYSSKMAEVFKVSLFNECAYPYGESA